MSYDDTYSQYVVKGGAWQKSHFATYSDALDEFLRRVKFTRNGFGIEITLHGYMSNDCLEICLNCVEIP